MKDIVYIVALKDCYKKYLELTTINKIFCGKYIKSEYGNVYFELNGIKAVVIIPEEWIEYMAPSKKCIKKEEYPYDLYYCGEKVGKIKLPLPLFSLNATDKSWEIK